METYEYEHEYDLKNKFKEKFIEMYSVPHIINGRHARNWRSKVHLFNKRTNMLIYSYN